MKTTTDHRPQTTDNGKTADSIQARMFVGGAMLGDEWVMYMPAGDHEIHANNAATNQPITKKIVVTPATVDVLQASLSAHTSAERRPYFDFDHEEKEASAWPVEFAWRTEPVAGVYARVEWSSKGKDAIQGKVYRSFSPSFYAEKKKNPAQVTGMMFCGGSLTNEPAFRKILPLWAKEAADEEQQTNGGQPPEPKESIMDKTQTAVDAAEFESLKAKAAKADLTEEENKKLREAIQARQAKDVEDAIQAAIKRGAIAPKDEALHAKLKKAGDVELINSLPGTDALQARQTQSEPVKTDVRVTGIGLTEAVKAYGDARKNVCDMRANAVQAKAAAREAGGIYAREIRPVIDKEGSLPIQAADTLVTDIVSQRVLDFLRYEFPLLSRISTNFTDEQLQLGQNVIVRTVTPPDVVSYNTTTGWPNSTTTTTDVPVPMTAPKAVQVRFQQNQLSGTRRRLFDEQAAPAAYSLRKELMDAVVALITTAFTPTGKTIALADWDRKGVIGMRNAMKKATIPMFNPFLLLSTDYYDKLAEDESIVSVAIQGSGDAIRTGMLPMIHGLQPIECQNESWANNIEGFAAVPSSLCLATGVPIDYTTVFPELGNGGGSVTIVSDAEIGISVMQVKFLNHQLADAYMRLAFMYGAARGPVTHGCLLKSA